MLITIIETFVHVWKTDRKEFWEGLIGTILVMGLSIFLVTL